ncbi:MAG: hypothetical protein ACD_67C00237G0002 [uncultured bacterium]|nr:MAG: hypothetical protein ACD_67C00237G0002 [uncultured bacterium]
MSKAHLNFYYRMKKFFQKQREVTALLLYVGVIFATVYFAVIPLMEKINSTNDQIQEELTKQEIASQHINELPKLQKQYEVLKSGDDLAEVLLNKDKAVVLIEKLEKTAQETNNEIVIKVQEVVDTKKATAKTKSTTENTLVGQLPSPEYLQLKIALNGSYGSIISFVKLLENFEYYNDVVEIRIDKGDGETQSFSNGVIESPFSLMEKGDTEKNTTIKKDVLDASLDVVFYTR